MTAARTVLITGASSGIGAQFAKSYAARGWNLVLVARRIDRLEALAADLRAQHNIQVTPFAADLSSRHAMKELMVFMELKQITSDGLVNNAGYSLAHTFMKTTAEQQIDFIEVCVTAPTWLAHKLLPGMLARGYGRIINVSSMVAFSPGAAGHTLYPAAKAYMLKFSRSLAAEVGDKGIKVTALCPGTTESEFQQANGMTEVLKAKPKRTGQTALAVVESAIRANEAGREVIITGWTNKIAVAVMTLLPDGLVTPLIRWGAKKFQIKE